MRGHPVWSLSRAHEFNPDIDGRRGGAYGDDSPQGRPPAVRPAETAIPAAIASQTREKLAAWDSRRAGSSSRGAGNAATAA